MYMQNNKTDNFPYSKEEFGNLCATVDFLILSIVNNASKQYPTHLLQIIKGYQSLKYPLLAIWEYYYLGNIDEILGMTDITLYQAFKIDAINTLKELITGISEQNPFDFYGKINNSDKVVEKLLKIYHYLLVNLQSGKLSF